jgi:RimJ/RimL family protein N-acetyltransferase
VLRAATISDVEATWRFRRLESVSRWLTRAPQDLGEYRRQLTDAKSLAKSLVFEHDGAVVGDLMVAVGDAWAQAEVVDRSRGVQADLGWAVHPGVGGRGFPTEAVRAVLRVCFVDLGLRRVTAACFAANEASWRLIERVGMRREAHNVADSLHRSGEWLDGYVYALLAHEWRSRGEVT